MKSWKTTLAGICAILAALANVGNAIAAGTAIDYPATIAIILPAIGLIFAKDSNVTGGSVKQ